MIKKTVFIGLSGGVDSAVSAALLKKATPNNFEKLFGRPTPKGFRGYDVVGVFIKTWHPDFLECNEEEERRDAMRVAASLDIPFLTFDFENVYKKEVADYMIREYKAGRTPNPDVMCNKHVKFGVFLKKAISMGADYVATGHYAIKKDSSVFFLVPPSLSRSKNTKESFLVKGKDPAKDQSYFLWTLNQQQLSKIIFPVGNLKKSEVRKLAKKFNLSVAKKKDSQGICFLGAIDLKEFLKHYIKEKRGKVVNEKGEIIGWHNGAVFSTLGERHGFTIIKKSPNDKRYYIVGKDVKKNILIVSENKNLSLKSLAQAGRAEQIKFSAENYLCFSGTGFCLSLENINWINKVPEVNKKYTMQIRYHGDFLPCKVKIISKIEVEVIYTKSILVASGQSCVIYDKDVCLGGGIVK